jgi:CubicO group peptidase (beta-lactamase class C family)
MVNLKVFIQKNLCQMTVKIFFTIFLCAAGSQIFAQKGNNIDTFIMHKMKEKKITGLQLAVVKNGKIIKNGTYGFANIQDSIKVDQNTIFTLNSITKAFTGVAIMQLVEVGKMNLEAPISTYLDSLPASWQKVTIRQLASHISGIPNMMDGNAQLIAENAEKSWEKVQKLPNEFAVGEQFSYNQTNYTLLKKAIERVTGLSFEEFVKKEQFEKARMPKIAKYSFGDFYDLTPHAARGYTYFVNGSLSNINPEIFPAMTRAAAGMQSTAIDIANWLLALQNLQLLKKKESLNEMWTASKLKNGETAGFGDLLNGYGIGWLTVNRQNRPAVASVGGGRNALFVYPKEQLAIVILTNLQGASPENFIDKIAKYYK